MELTGSSVSESLPSGISSRTGGLSPRRLIEMYRLRPPDLVIMDGILAMEGYGPCSPETRRVNKVLAAADAVALDTVLARMVGFRTDEVPYLRIARDLGIGRTDPDAIEVDGDFSPIEGFNRPVVAPESTYCYLAGVGGGRPAGHFMPIE